MEVSSGSIVSGVHGRYRVARQVGAGGIGQVWRAQAIATGKPVAVKILHDDRFALTDAVYERFVREIEHGKHLTHPNLVRVLDHSVPVFGPAGSRKYDFLVMEFVDGAPLSTRLAHLGAGDRVGIALGVLDGIAYLHDCGFLHRDLKTNNILISPDGRVVICDYGLLKKERGDAYLTNSADKLGSLLYISQHQQADPDAATRADDVYSLCACLFEIFSGTRMSIRWTAQHLRFGTPELESLLRRVLLERVPSEKWPSVEALRELVARVRGVGTRAAILHQLSRAQGVTLEWCARVGSQRWKNEILVLGDVVVIGGGPRSGRTTGVVAFAAQTGVERWFVPTASSSTALAFHDGAVVFGTLTGQVYSVGAMDGNVRWRVDAGAPVVARPVPAENRVGFFSMDGRWTLVDAVSGEVERVQEIGCNVVADPIAVEGDYWAVARDGRAVRVSLARYEAKVGRALTYEGVTGRAPMEVAARLCVAGGKLVQGFVRDTTYADPPIVCFEPIGSLTPDVRVVWHAHDPGNGPGYGNLRGQVVAHDGMFFATGAYGNSLYRLNDRGRVDWSVKIGYAEWPQWAPPVFWADLALVPRHDGFLHIVDVRARRRVNSIFLGLHDGALTAVPGNQDFLDAERHSRWEGPAALVSPAAVAGNLVLQASAEGWLYALAGIVE